MSDPVVPMRESCRMCWRISAVSFAVPNDIWREAIHPFHHNSIVCLDCFIRRADEKLLPWDKSIQFFPTSMRTHLGVIESAALMYESEADDGSV